MNEFVSLVSNVSIMTNVLLISIKQVEFSMVQNYKKKKRKTKKAEKNFILASSKVCNSSCGLSFVCIPQWEHSGREGSLGSSYQIVVAQYFAYSRSIIQSGTLLLRPASLPFGLYRHQYPTKHLFLFIRKKLKIKKKYQFSNNFKFM